MSTLTYLITGANRGLGLECVRQILANEPESRVIATARDPANSDALRRLADDNAGRVEILKLDITSHGVLESVKAAAIEAGKLALAQDGIDILFNNAAVSVGGWSDILEPDVLGHLDANLKVNAFGSIATTQAFLPLLRKGHRKTIWNTSSVCGSLGGPFSSSTGAIAGYSISKAAVNMITVKFARSLQDEKFTVLALHPGHVKTDLGGPDAEIEVEESVSGSLKTLHSKSAVDNGTFWQWNGEPVAW